MGTSTNCYIRHFHKTINKWIGESAEFPLCAYMHVYKHIKKGQAFFPRKKSRKWKWEQAQFGLLGCPTKKKTKMKMNPTHCLNEQSHNDIITVTLKTTTFMPNIRSYCHSWSKGMQRQLLQDNKACTQIPKLQTIKKNNKNYKKKCSHGHNHQNSGLRICWNHYLNVAIIAGFCA